MANEKGANEWHDGIDEQESGCRGEFEDVPSATKTRTEWEGEMACVITRKLKDPCLSLKLNKSAIDIRGIDRCK